MANTRPAKTRPPGEGRGGGPLVKDPVEARQGFRDRPILYVLIASLVLVIAAYLIIAAIVPA